MDYSNFLAMRKTGRYGRAMADTPSTDADTGLINPLDRLLGYQLRRASVAMMADLAEALGDLALRPSEASVLLLIEANPGTTQSTVGRALGIKRANMAPVTAMLIARGFIDRAPADGRSHRLQLSKKGKAMARKIARRIAQHEARFLEALPLKARAGLVEKLRGIWASRGPARNDSTG
jgi:DNA-binding MarR family transcriptional regulator